MLKIGVLASGRGSNLQALIDASKSKDKKYVIALVISDQEGVQALERAQGEDIPNFYLNPREFPGKRDFEQGIIDLIQEYDCDLICLAGFMRILTPFFITNVGRKILNIHPSLLPSFPGLNAHQQALDYGVRYSGCTVHFIDEGVDSGPIILQAIVPVEESDTVEELSARILEQEHLLYPLAVQLIAEDKISFVGRKVKISGQAAEQLKV